MIRVLMTGGGAPGAPGILKCLKQNQELNITVADANPDAVGRFLHNDFTQIPFASHPDFIPEVLELCRKKNIRVIMPLVTRELFPLSENKELFLKNNVKVLVSDFNYLSIANNKSKLYGFLAEQGIEVPAFRVAKTVEEFEEAVHALGYPGSEVCFKPSVSNGSRGFRIISDKVDERDLLFNQKPNSLYIRLTAIVNILSSGTFPELLVSEVLPGEEYSVDCLANKGNTLLAVPRLRKKMTGGISVEGEFVNEKGIINYSGEIIKALHLHGNIGIQVKRSVRNSFMLLEINPRVQFPTNPIRVRRFDLRYRQSFAACDKTPASAASLLPVSTIDCGN